MIKKQNIPNLLSVIRLMLIPVFVYLFFTNYPENLMYALSVYILASITDVADGFIARKFGFITKLGRFLDPLADKLLQLSAFMCFWIKDLIPWWLVVVFIIKEGFLGLGAAIIFSEEKDIAMSNFFGKTATVVIFIAVIVISVFAYAEHPLEGIVMYSLSLFVIAYILLALLLYYKTLFMGKYKIIKK